MVTKNALVTVNIGGVLRENSRLSFQAAARRWGCDYIEITEGDAPAPHMMKLRVFELCDADRVFFVDADAVISAGCPSPFEAFPGPGFVAADNQQKHMDGACLRACIDTLRTDFALIAQQYGKTGPLPVPGHFINSGVWLASRNPHAELLKRAYEIATDNFGRTAWRDQSALNYALIEGRHYVVEMPATWNYQFPPDSGAGPMQEFIYHWAGGDNRDRIEGVNWGSFKGIRSSAAAVDNRPKLLLVADFCVPTGFARVAENIALRLRDRWNVSVIGINYNGTPHDFPFKIWPARLYGDIWGLGTLNYMIPQIQPDAILLIQDPWIAARFANEIDRCGIPMAAYMPVDAKNQHPGTCQRLRKLDLAILYTKFGEVEIRIPGYRGESAVIPHAVDTGLYRPLDRAECRRRMRIFDGDSEVDLSEKAFIVGNVNRNQPRKRLDLTIQFFAEWLKRTAGDPRQRIDDAYLYLHCAQNDSAGLDLLELAHYYGISNRVIMPDASLVTPSQGLPEAEMPSVYGAFDVQVTTTAGEGWGLSQIEGMACGIPQIVPQFAALGEWAAGGAYMVPCSDERQAHPVISTIGATPAKEPFIRALDYFYRDPEARASYSRKALARARDPQFSWDSVADQFHAALNRMLETVRAQAHEQKRDTERKEAGDGQV